MSFKVSNTKSNEAMLPTITSRAQTKIFKIADFVFGDISRSIQSPAETLQQELCEL